jgi:hypothetical protein
MVAHCVMSVEVKDEHEDIPAALRAHFADAKFDEHRPRTLETATLLYQIMGPEDGLMLVKVSGPQAHIDLLVEMDLARPLPD